MLESLFNKIAGLQFLNRCFPVNIAKFLRAAFLTEHLRWLLLNEVTIETFRHGSITDAPAIIFCQENQESLFASF